MEAAPDFMTAADSDALYVNEGFTNGLTNGPSGSTHIIRCYYSLVVTSYQYNVFRWFSRDV